MSAFVVDPKTINYILSTLQNMNMFTLFSAEVMKKTSISFNKYCAIETIGRAMYRMNIKAVQARYPHNDQLPASYEKDSKGEYTIIKKYTFERIHGVSIVQGMKYLSCFLYQCSEGTIFKWKLFKLLEALQGEIAQAYVARLPEYEKANWG